MKHKIYFILLVLTIIGTTNAYAELMWRRAPVTAYEKKYRVPTEFSDITVASDGTIYMSDGSVKKLVGDLWVDIDPFADGLGYNERENIFTALNVVGKKSNGKNIYGQLGRMKEPDRMMGIAYRLSINDSGEFWVTTILGRIYKGGPKNWNRVDAHGHEVVTGPGGQAVVMTFEPVFQEHKDWLSKHPNPMYFDGSSWHELDNLPGPYSSFAFDSDGELWLLTMTREKEPRSGKVYQRRGSSWELMPEVPNARHIDISPDGSIYVLAYTQTLDKEKNRYIYDNGRFHYWKGDHWFDDTSVPNLKNRVRVGKYFHGLLIMFQNKLTWAHQSKWLTVKDVAVKAEKPKPKLAPIASLGEVEEEEDNVSFEDLFQTKKTPKTSDSSAAFVGCWDWSNGVHVKVFEDGLVDIGIFKAKWKQGNATNQFSVKWPSIYDYLDIQADGQTYSGESSLKVPISMTRIKTKGADPIGLWKRIDGAQLELKEDGTVTAGTFQGLWTKKGSQKLILEWPVVDNITIASDGQSLSTQTQFEKNTAARAQCSK